MAIFLHIVWVRRDSVIRHEDLSVDLCVCMRECVLCDFVIRMQPATEPEVGFVVK